MSQEPFCRDSYLARCKPVAHDSVEYHSYAQKEPERAGELTNREAGYITEIIAKVALKEGYNVLVDGSLRNSTWYGQYFRHLRSEYPVLRIAILHITAPEEAILDRAEVCCQP